VKTQIIQLSVNEDVISVQDKMNWSQAGRILLVWPPHERVLDRKLDLDLISRKATALGAQLVLVTQDKKIHFYAGQLGIQVVDQPHRAFEAQNSPIFPKQIYADKLVSREKLETLRTASRSKTPQWKDHPVVRSACLTISMLALFVLGIFILPGAKIILIPRTESQSMLLNLMADPAIKSINYSTGSLPMISREVIVEGQDVITPTGSVNISDKPATGSIRLTNVTDLPITIPHGMIISTSGDEPVKFITTSPDSQHLGPQQSVTLNARALQPGIYGNLAADELVIFEGDLAPSLEVTNPQAMTGGHNASVPAATEHDMDLLRHHLLAQLMQDALLQIQSGVNEDDIILSPSISNVEILSETYFPAVGEPANQLNLSMKIKLQAQLVLGETIRAFSNIIMDANTPTGFTQVANSLVITQQSNLTLADDGKAHWTIKAARQVQANITPAIYTRTITGKTVTQASQRLSYSLPISGQASIILSPNWWPRLPLLAMRIEFVQESQ
jgi:hypothetical protein